MIEETMTSRPAWWVWTQVIRQWRRWLLCTRTRQKKRLLVSESVSLGDKRVLMVAQFEQKRFLIGVTGSSMVLLSKLPSVDSND